jgi:hypothetical protein
MTSAIKTILIAIILLQTGYTFAQTDTIIVYNIQTKTIDTILPVAFNQTTTSDHSAFSIGSLGSQTSMSLSPPATNLFSNSQFSDIARARLFFNVKDYPVRTATKLSYFKNGLFSGSCSGTMVAKDFVLTAGHCAYSYLTQVWGYDSIQASPDFDNDAVQSPLFSSMVEKVYIFKTYYDKRQWDDVALMQLKQPIGLQSGWIGIAFNSDTSYFTGKVFHKFSYPGVRNPADTLKVYNGDTLYYNYGYINNLPPCLGINSPNALGIPGQSGSSFLYTDNTSCYSYGVMSYSNMYRHYIFRPDIFYQLKNILEQYSLSIKDDSPTGNKFRLFPDPFNQTATIEFDNALHENYILTIFDSQGRVARIVNGINAGRIEIDKDDLTEGLYFFQLRSERRSICGKFILQ